MREISERLRVTDVLVWPFSVHGMPKWFLTVHQKMAAEEDVLTKVLQEAMRSRNMVVGLWMDQEVCYDSWNSTWDPFKIANTHTHTSKNTVITFTPSHHVFILHLCDSLLLTQYNHVQNRSRVFSIWNGV